MSGFGPLGRRSQPMNKRYRQAARDQAAHFQKVRARAALEVRATELEREAAIRRALEKPRVTARARAMAGLDALRARRSVGLHDTVFWGVRGVRPHCPAK